jgi:ribosomal protein S17E
MRNFIIKKLKTILNENFTQNTELVDKLLDKISQSGINSLSAYEKQYLHKVTKGNATKEDEELLNISSGYRFNEILSMGETIVFIYSETEEYDIELVHKGIFKFDEEEFLCEIFSDLNGLLNYFTLHDGVDYVDLNESVEKELNKFFATISVKIFKSL